MDVVLGMSGGVDSTACAILLKNAGYTVHGVWMDNGSGTPDRARQCAELLGIELAEIDMREEFQSLIESDFVESYLRGYTPNPCVICNPLVKFKALFDYADSIGAEYVATGHYAKVKNGMICRGEYDHEQSYMLYRLPDEWIKRLIFPLGEFKTKDEVRSAASVVSSELGSAKASMDICFIPDGDFADFIEKRGIVPPPGDFVDEDGKVLGRHRGIHHYTVGMRRHLGIAAGQRIYVKRIDPESNRIILAKTRDSEENIITIRDCVWHEVPVLGKIYSARVRHSKNLGTAKVISADNGVYTLSADASCGVPTPGQSAVLYDGDRLIGGGFIFY